VRMSIGDAFVAITLLPFQPAEAHEAFNVVNPPKNYCAA
jgi:hypothetical protein